jgi:hypothetical protein
VQVPATPKSNPMTVRKVSRSNIEYLPSIIEPMELYNAHIKNRFCLASTFHFRWGWTFVQTISVEESMVSNGCETSRVRVVAEKSEVMLDASGRGVTENEGEIRVFVILAV